MNRLRVVLDTNILVSALLTPSGNPAKVYRMVLTGFLSMVYSEEILAEYLDVLYRPHLRIPSDQADRLIGAIRQLGEQVTPAPSKRHIADEDDRMFYDAANISGAYLITGNTRHYPKDKFILTPTGFLEL
jgi:putative PIN family toxin of toxin-antitoxin system